MLRKWGLNGESGEFGEQIIISSSNENLIFFFTKGINVQEPVEEVGNEDIEFVILEMKHKRHVLA